LFYQQWYEDSASQWSIVNGQKNLPFTTHHSPPHSYGDSAGITPDFPFNQGDNFELSSIATIKLWLRRTLVLKQFYSTIICQRTKSGANVITINY
jgi:hypothetical protein